MLLSRLVSLAALIGVSIAELKVHDETFEPEYVLEATAKNITINCESRRSVTLNGTSPGPTLYLREGHTTWVRVYNRMSDQNLTIHWHGLSQRTAPFSDGTPLVSQWPIAPQQFFDYQIRPEIGDAGTYFYHSHIGFQQSTAHGALIVLDAKSTPQKYDKDITLLLADYYDKTDHEIEKGLTGDPFKWSGEPQAITIQGSSGKAGFGNATDASCAPHIIDVEPGKTYRLRAIGATVLSLVKIGIEGHDQALRVIEADAADTKPVPIDHIQVTSGQRFSYLLKTKSKSEMKASNKTHYWVRYESRDRPQSITGYALLRYKVSGADRNSDLPPSLPTTPPVTLSNDTTSYLEYKLHPRLKSVTKEFPKLSEVTRTVVIQVNQKLETGNYVNGTLNGTLVWAQNDFSWREQTQSASRRVPYLIQVYRTGQGPNYDLALKHGGFDPESNTFPAKIGEVLDIVWSSNSGPTGGFDFHPMHIHGDHAWDLGSGDGMYNATENEKHFEHDTPLRRDTTILYRYRKSGAPHMTAGWRAWRIRITEENVGAWMMHCHIAQHAVMGMNTVWMFGDAADIKKKFPEAPYLQGYLDFGGSAYGNKNRNPKVYHYLPEADAFDG